MNNMKLYAIEIYEIFMGQLWDNCGTIFIFAENKSTMARIKFMIRSTINPARIYVRIREGKEIDLKVPSNFYVDIENWNPNTGKPKRNSNNILKELDANLDELNMNILSKINELKSKKLLNADNLKEALMPKQESESNEIDKNYLSTYLEYYIENLKPQIQIGKLKKTILNRYKIILGIVVEMEKLYKTKYKIKDVNTEFIKTFDFFCIDVKKYMPNTAGRAIKYIKTICRDARNNGIESSLYLDTIKGYTSKTEFITFTPKELDIIEQYEFINQSLDNVRDWLIISCFTGQRVSDFLRFTDDMIVEIEKPNGEKHKIIEFTQVKTDKEMRLPLHPKVLKILEKRNGKFPYKLSDPKYNEYIKLVCKEVGINNIVKGSKIDSETKRKTSGKYQKWELITSHIGRRSFATNNYGKTPTPLIMYATGHTTEKMLLNYIGKTNDDKALELLSYMEL